MIRILLDGGHWSCAHANDAVCVAGLTETELYEAVARWEHRSQTMRPRHTATASVLQARLNGG